jgi:hypothetical protein
MGFEEQRLPRIVPSLMKFLLYAFFFSLWWWKRKDVVQGVAATMASKGPT